MIIEMPKEGEKENFIALKVKNSKMSKGDILAKVKAFNGRPYAFKNAYDEKHKMEETKNQPIDCFKFAVDLLNDILLMHDGIRLLPNEGKEPEGEERDGKKRDNDDRFNDILPNSFGTIKRKKK